MTIKVPFYRQPLNSSYCAPFVLKAVIEYIHELKIPKDKICKECNCKYKSGTSLSTIESVLKKYKVRVKSISFKYIKRAIKRKNPVLITYLYKNSAHISLIVGIKNINGIETAILNDPYFGKNFYIPTEILQLLVELDDNWIKEVKYV